MKKNVNNIAKELVGLFGLIEDVLTIRGTLIIPDAEDTFFSMEIINSICVNPIQNIFLEKGTYFLSKRDFRINAIIKSSSGLAIKPMTIHDQDGAIYDFDFFKLITILKKYNKNLIKKDALKKIIEIEKKITEIYSKSENEKEKFNLYITETLSLLENSNSFIKLLNGTATNQLNNINTNSIPPIIDVITGKATIEQGTLKVFIDKYSELKGVRTSTLKLLDTCTMYLTEQNNYRGNDKDINSSVTIPLEQYMKLCGIPLTKSSKDKTRRKVKEDLETLYHISLEWSEPSGRRTKDFAKMRICDKIAIIRGNIIFSFSKDMAKYLTNAYIMQYPMELLKTDERNSNLYPLGRKLLLHYSINNNRKKGTANIISVKSLLEVCPDIPTYEQVFELNRNTEQRIKAPFEKALNALPFINWEYSNSKGLALTEEQITSTNYKIFEKLYVKFDVIGFPPSIGNLKN